MDRAPVVVDDQAIPSNCLGNKADPVGQPDVLREVNLLSEQQWGQLP